MRLWLLAIIAVLAYVVPAWSDDLKVENVTATYGPYGPLRSDVKAPLKAHPGEVIFFRCVIRGLGTDSDGNVQGQFLSKLKDKDGKALKEERAPVKGFFPLGASEAVGAIHIAIAQDLAPGKYKFALAVVDDTKKKEASSADFDIEVLPQDFCLINLLLSLDPEGRVNAPATMVAGQNLFLKFQATGFDRSKKKIKLVMLLRTLDDKGKELTPKPLRVELGSEDEKEVEGATTATFNGNVSLNRPGNFQLKITVNDEVNKKEVELLIPLKVVD
jgi:hypothetical protein